MFKVVPSCPKCKGLLDLSACQTHARCTECGVRCERKNQKGECTCKPSRNSMIGATGPNKSAIVKQELKVEKPQADFDRSGWKRKFNCDQCAEELDVDDLIAMLVCEHRFCGNCIRRHFVMQIKKTDDMLLKCPACSKPEFEDGSDKEEVDTYKMMLDELVKALVSHGSYQMFREKKFRKVENIQPVGGQDKTCPICSTPMNEKNSAEMLGCKERICRGCAKVHFEGHITNGQDAIIQCPLCDMPSFAVGEATEQERFLKALDNQVKGIVSNAAYERFSALRNGHLQPTVKED